MLGNLTFETFEPLVGSSFWTHSGNQKLELRLVRVGKVMESEAARLPRHPFSLFFIGPSSLLLPQSTYRITHEQLEPMDIFIVPVANDAQTYTYEAVFA